MLRTYNELVRLETFEERFDYLKLGGEVGSTTFGFDRHMNQGLYRSAEWRKARRDTIVRDLGCDLGVEGYEIHGSLVVHHMNPLVPDDILHGEDHMFDPRYLITTTHDTHNAIHYGDSNLLRQPFVERASGDTKLW